MKKILISQKDKNFEIGFPDYIKNEDIIKLFKLIDIKEIKKSELKGAYVGTIIEEYI